MSETQACLNMDEKNPVKRDIQDMREIETCNIFLRKFEDIESRHGEIGLKQRYFLLQQWEERSRGFRCKKVCRYFGGKLRKITQMYVCIDGGKNKEGEKKWGQVILEPKVYNH